MNLGIISPCHVKQAFELDEKNDITLWKDSMTKEIENIQSYHSFKDMGKVTHVSGYETIIFCFVFAVKHDL
jgi:nitric oxide synthase oxygenase domain/subunit